RADQIAAVLGGARLLQVLEPRLLLRGPAGRSEEHEDGDGLDGRLRRHLDPDQSRSVAALSRARAPRARRAATRAATTARARCPPCPTPGARLASTWLDAPGPRPPTFLHHGEGLRASAAPDAGGAARRRRRAASRGAEPGQGPRRAGPPAR